jgi:hypothetical protein
MLIEHKMFELISVYEAKKKACFQDLQNVYEESISVKVNLFFFKFILIFLFFCYRNLIKMKYKSSWVM